MMYSIGRLKSFNQIKWRMGQLQRRAAYSLYTGASVTVAVKTSGLSLRRVKVIAKQLGKI